MKELQRKLLAVFEVEHRDHLEAVRGMLDDLEKADWRLGAVDLVEFYRRVHSLKGAARAVDLRPVEALAHRLETVISRCQKGHATLDVTAANVVRLALDAIEDSVARIDANGRVTLPQDVVAAVEALSALGDAPTQAVGPARPGEFSSAEPEEEPPEPAAGLPEDTTEVAAPRGRSLRIDADNLDGLFESAAEILTTTTAQLRLATEFQALEHEIKQAQHSIDALRQAELDRPEGAVVDLARMRHVQEIEAWIHRFDARLLSFGSRQRAAGWRLRQSGRRLEAQVLKMRLVPADTVFDGMRRMVRDLGSDQGKLIRLDARGLETLADRSVLQSLRDPVMHVLRNAATHGIEAPDDRATVGKAREGRIRLDISARCGRLVVRVEDDGRGIDLEGVRRMATARGLRPADPGTHWDPRKLTELLSEPGFSTLNEATELAGRGIGLSVVATAVARMLGDFTIRPRSDGGTAVTLSVPISVSSTRLIMVRCRDRVYGIPVHGVERLHRLPRDRIVTMEGWPVTQLDGAGPLRLVSLARLLDGENMELAGDTALPVVVLRTRGARVGAIVDALVAVHDGVVRDLGPAAGAQVAGGVVTDTGNIVPVLDVQALIDVADRMAAHPVVRPAPETGRTAPSILVVDDSITTRTLEKSILEANGFRVRLSVDGVDALEQLRAEVADLVICDIEMPRMDGFDLLRAMRRDGVLAAIPVILVTSRSSDEDRRRGLSLGADAYVIKQRFDQTDLLMTIGQLL